ncbi:hypothetical protein RHSIM_Rhsim12G0012300 [Rhododendron simsii]|uniref:Uncharacterized protein n=1 Tax=Rhododendron simsii TaxID=118357 RepID=A0A834G2N1_RHOSS|nr:hypothetical protein RHSIM_Rhsim12G0012300 [Rhododendron simsii]
MWVKVLKASYFPTSSPWEAKNGTSPFWIWTCLPEGREIIIRRLQVGNGKSINVWSDKWVGYNPKLVILGPPPANCSMKVVRDLMVDNGKGWNHSLVQSLFNLEIFGAIVATLISWTDKEDEVCWSHNKSNLKFVQWLVLGAITQICICGNLPLDNAPKCFYFQVVAMGGGFMLLGIDFSASSRLCYDFSGDDYKTVMACYGKATFVERLERDFSQFNFLLPRYAYRKPWLRVVLAPPLVEGVRSQWLLLWRSSLSCQTEWNTTLVWDRASSLPDLVPCLYIERLQRGVVPMLVLLPLLGVLQLCGGSGNNGGDKKSESTSIEALPSGPSAKKPRR